MMTESSFRYEVTLVLVNCIGRQKRKNRLARPRTI